MRKIIKRWREKRIAKEMRKDAFNIDLAAERIKREQAEQFASYSAGYYGPDAVPHEIAPSSLIRLRACPMCGGKLI